MSTFWDTPAVTAIQERMMLLSELKLTDHEEAYATRSEYYWGHQYDHLEPWDTDKDVGLYEKKPRLRPRLTKKAVDTVNSYLFGERRRPRFTRERTGEELEGYQEELEERAQQIAQEDGVPGVVAQAQARKELSQEDPVDSRLSELERESGLVELYLEIGRLGLLQGSVAVGFHKQTLEGRTYYDCEILHGAGSKPIYGRDDKARAAEEGVPFGHLLEIDERWRETVKVDGKEKTFLHRRRWTTQATIEYEPIDVAQTRAVEDLEWEQYLDEEATVEHGLGFVPAVWIPNGVVAHEKDGVPLVGEAERTLEDEVAYTLSQTGRGIAYNQDPRTVFVDVDNLSDKPIKIGADNSIAIRSSAMGDHQATLEKLELQGSGQEVGMAFSQLLKALFFELANVVLHNPDQWSGALSGVALERILEPMLAIVEALRPIYGRRLSRLLSRMYKADTGQEVRITENWGELVTPTVQDRRDAVQTDGDALERGLITERTATEAIAPYYGIEDVDAYLVEKAVEVGELGTTNAQEAQADQQLEETLDNL